GERNAQHNQRTGVGVPEGVECAWFQPRQPTPGLQIPDTISVLPCLSILPLEDDFTAVTVRRDTPEERDAFLCEDHMAGPAGLCWREVNGPRSTVEIRHRRAADLNVSSAG